jgi:citrate synthase
MMRQNVVSSELRSVGYDERSIVLEVEFQSGGIYRYFGVPRELYLSLMSAGSKGRFFNMWIRDRHYCQRVA